MKGPRYILAVIMMMGCTYSAAGATRVLSVYMESFSALQRNIFEGAEVFEVPELGSVPMLISMSMPGSAQLDRTQPIALHVYAPAAGITAPAVVLDVAAANTPEALLGAMLARSGAVLPDPQEGRYVTEQGVAQVRGQRVLLARSEGDLEQALAAGVPEGLPAVPGVIRMTIAPSELAGLLDDLRPMMTASMDAAQEVAMFNEMLSLYQSGMEQISVYEQGIGVSAKGLEIRSRVVPAPGRAGAKIVRSLQPAPAGWVSALEGKALMAMASGGYRVPEDVVKRVLDQYLAILTSMQDEIPLDPDMFRALMEPSLASMGAPTFFFADLDADLSQLRYYGGAAMADASAILQEMLAVQKTEAFETYLQASGMQVAGPETREVAGHTVYRTKMTMDEEALQQRLQEAGATMPAEELANMQKFMNVFLSGQDYAATAQGMVFTSGGDEQVKQALALLEGRDANADAADPAGILALLAPPVPPYGVGRIDLLGMLRMGAAMQGEDLPFALPPEGGVGLLFAGWKTKGQVEQFLLVPAADIRAMAKAVRSSMQQ